MIVYQSKDQFPIVNNDICKLYFDGASSKDGSGIGLHFISPLGEQVYFSIKLDFETTNNLEEYEALVATLDKARIMKIHNLSIFRDSELIINQFKKMSNKTSKDEIL